MLQLLCLIENAMRLTGFAPLSTRGNFVMIQGSILNSVHLFSLTSDTPGVANHL
jgi:hypothetical protein